MEKIYNLFSLYVHNKISILNLLFAINRVTFKLDLDSKVSGKDRISYNLEIPQELPTVETITPLSFGQSTKALQHVSVSLVEPQMKLLT